MGVSASEVGGRVREVRGDLCGERGKGGFAELLGLSATTYGYYEGERLPPVDVCVRIAAVAKVDLTWLLTGRGAKYVGEELKGAMSEAEREVQGLLARRPGMSGMVLELVEALRGVAGLGDERAEKEGLAVKDLIPVVGGMSGGAVGYWEEVARRGAGSGDPRPTEGAGSGDPRPTESGEARPTGGGGARAIDRRIRRLLRRGRVYRKRRVEVWGENRVVPAEGRARVVEMTGAEVEGVVELLEWPRLKKRYRDAVAWRVDGDVMSPLIEDGSLVVVSGEVAASEGWACVARLAGAVGVMCRLYEGAGDDVVLGAVDGGYREIRVGRREVEWVEGVIGVAEGG